MNAVANLIPSDEPPPPLVFTDSAASKVKELVDGYLADLYNDSTRTVTIKELYSFTPKPRQGIIEIWLGLGNPA